MKKHIRTLSVVPLAALAVSVCALYPTKTEIFTREPTDYKNAAVRLTAPSEPDTSAENITDPKSAVLDKVLNTIDRLDRVYMTARTNMIGDGETTLTFDVDISAGLSHQSVAESGVTVSETYSDTNMGMVSIDHRTKRYTPDCLPVYTRSDTPYIPLDERITYEDGIPCYRYRRNITNCPLASYCLVPQELAFSVLSDTGSWEISDEPVIHPDTGRSCVVITGVPSDYFAAKHGIDSFSMSVDEETGVILIFEGKKEDGVVIYTYVAEFDTAQETPVGRSDAASFADYEQEVIWYNKS